MRDSLPKNGPKLNENAIVNLDDFTGQGTHWVAYTKKGNRVSYFDSFGNLRPPLDLMKYLNVDAVQYNHTNYQDYDTFNCGHLCLKFLSGQLI